ncbi:MAG: UDP-glucose--hexose-1-phosphate uridylyltransferase [Armatimonadetes bacterium]|nr:UDP-glucose--hexose-1-phosphate uridylyltransferase [Armatimonadota bacterium]
MANLESYPHRRYNPLLDEWVLVSPHRTQRPWQGQREAGVEDRPSYDPTCYLCPGNTRANGETNPAYDSTFVFQNDYSALLSESATVEPGGHPLFHAEPVTGECRVICFSPRHDLTLAEMSTEEISSVVSVWCDQYRELSAKYEWVQIFENKGAVMGCSNPHPHGQIWASDVAPTLAQNETKSQLQYFQKHGIPMLQSVIDEELARRERVVVETEHWAALVPFWAVWPFEILLLPKRSVPTLLDMSDAVRADLPNVMSQLLIRYDNLFETSFPYSMGWHNAPKSIDQPQAWTLHAHFYPPLLRSASVKKFMVGYEMMAEPQRDLTAEQAASRLRDVSSVHYKQA